MTYEEAFSLLRQYNSEAFHITHALTVSKVMRRMAGELGYGEEADFWAVVGLLHDIDFEQWPDEHCKKCVELLEKAGCKVTLTDLAREDMAEAVEDAFRYDRLVLATTTYNADIFPFMKTFIHHLTERNFQNRTVAFMENGSWAPTAAKAMAKLLEGCKNLTYAQTTVRILGALNQESRSQIADLAKELS